MSIHREPLEALLGIHKGEPCILLANGVSLNDVDWSRVPKHVKTIGMNGSWTNHWANYHVCVDFGQSEMAANMYNRIKSEKKEPKDWGCKGQNVFQQMGKEGRLFTWGGSWPTAFGGIPMPTMCRANRAGRQTALSFSPNFVEGIQTGLAGFGTVAYVALQVAVSLGFTTMFWVGLDLGAGGAHHHGWWPADEERMKKQNQLFEHAEQGYLAPRGIKSYVVASPKSNCTVWPKIGFDKMLEMLMAKP